MKDRRKLQRFDLALASSVEILDAAVETTKDPYSCFTRDVSSGGAYFPTTQPLLKGTRVRVNMVLCPDEKPQPFDFAEVQATGYVVRTDPCGMAVCFSGRCRIVRADQTGPGLNTHSSDSKCRQLKRRAA